MIININHFSITVSNIEDSIQFYQDILGFTLEGVRYNISEDYLREVIGYDNGVLHIAFLKCPGGRIELIKYVQPQSELLDVSTKNVGTSHICFDVSDILTMHEELVKKGAKFQSKPVLIDRGPNKGAYAVYLKGPDNITIELLQKP